MTTGFCRSSFWVKTSILVSSFGLHLISLGMVTSFGVMYSGLRDQLNSGAAETSWIASLSSGLFLMFGPVAGILEKRFGCRLVAMTGSALIGVGMLASAFVPTLFWLYLTYGVITGVGFGMAHLVANVIVNLKFNKRRSMAIAVASAGGGCGNIVIPWLTTIWLEVYGWRQTFLLLAGIGLQGIVFGAIIFKVSTSNDSGGSHRTDHSSDGPSIRAEVSTILKTKMFLVFSVSGFCTAMAYFVPYVMIPELAKVKGVSTTDVALVFSVSGVSSIVGRILVGFIIDVLHIDRIWTLSIALMTGGISTIGYAFVYNKWLFIAYGAILGIFTGTFGFLQSVIVVDLLGTELLGIGFGFLTLFHGIAVIIGPPLAGWISDVTNDYTVPFIYAGCLFCLASFLACVIKIRDYCNFSKCDDHVSSRFDDIPVNNGSYTNSNFVFDTKL
ncbi:monocarboxylate transporter 14-like [Ylistrum balloti]|uniref:monocarboxylate transporter 14-like n=1 Tax=Ylistrum balloti TaxID=509963 RepID=UPI002905E85C|nr:monocarboxylate transporter 14-like [Ylistrum balloti]